MLDNVVLDGVGVEHGLGGGEGLAVDDDERLLQVQSLHSPVEVNGVDVGEEPELPALGSGFGLGVLPKCFVDEFRSEVGAADADDQGVLEGLARVAENLASPHEFGEAVDALKDGVDVVDDVAFGGGGELLSGGHTQGDVKDRAALGGVELLAFEHALDVLEDLGLLGDGEELGEASSVELGVGEVEGQLLGVGGDKGCAQELVSWLVLEQLSQVGL